MVKITDLCIKHYPTGASTYLFNDNYTSIEGISVDGGGWGVTIIVLRRLIILEFMQVNCL